MACSRMCSRKDLLSLQPFYGGPLSQAGYPRQNCTHRCRTCSGRVHGSFLGAIECSHGLGGVFCVLHLLLQSFDFDPCPEAWPNRSQLKLFQENGGLIHSKKSLSVDFLLFEYLAVLPFHAHVFQVFCHACGRPVHHFLLRVQVLLLLFRFLSVDVGQSMVAAVLAARVVGGHGS